LILIGLILVAPLLQSSPLQTDDGALHIYRTVALDRALHDGLLYPRWFPDLAYGYGFPFFNFREPLGYYGIEALHLIGLSIPLSLNLILAVSVIFSGLAMLWWVSDIFDLNSGFVAGVLYMASPYVLIGPIERGNMPEVIALALLPLILFCFRRLIAIGGRKYFFAAVVSYSALLLTHNISSLIFSPLLVVYVFVVRGAWSVSESPRNPTPLHYGGYRTQHATRNAVITIILSLSLTAFFWLPALTEGGSVQLYLTHSNRNNDYHFNFLPLAELFSGPGSSDPNLLNPPLNFMLGWPQIIAAVLGLSLLWRKPAPEQRAHIIAALVAALAFIFMTLPVSLPLWDNLPLIRFIQFPWRFVGRAALPLSLLGGATVYYFQSRFSRRLAISLSLLLSVDVLMFAAPLLYPHISSIKNNLTVNDVFTFEHRTGMIGIDPVGAYLPVTIQQRPVGSPLEADYQSAGAIRRFDRSTLPPDASIINEAYGPNRASIDLSSPIGFRATYLAFDFPGWQATIDQRPVSITPSDPNGLITFDVPAGQHHIEVSFGSTPIRSLADIVSAIALLVFVAVLIKMKFQPTAITSRPSAISHQPLSFVFVPIIFLAIKLLLIDAQLTPLRSTRLGNDQIAGISHPLQIDFGGQMRLLGYDLSSPTAPSGGSVRIDLYWRALTNMGAEYQTTVGLVNDRGEVWSPKSLDRPRDFQDAAVTTQWPSGSYMIDSFELPINPGTPPDQYSIFVEVFRRSNLIPLPAQAAAQHPVKRSADAIIGTLNVSHAKQIFDSQQLGIYNFTDAQVITPDLKLLGANRDRDDAAPGDTVLLTLFWQALQPPAKDYAHKIELVDSQNQSVQTRGFNIGSVNYPTSGWLAHEQMIDLDRVRIPIGLATGTYHWQLTIDQQPAIDLGPLRVSAPDRSFVMPSILYPVNQTFDHKITLLGYQVEGKFEANQQVAVVLYWRAETEMDASYKVFVHVLGVSNQLLAQTDSIPLNGSRPTIGWQPGEILTDTYRLNLPGDLYPGFYQFATGLYNPDDLVRLKLANGEDHVEWSEIVRMIP
jgi:hypothetical protein